MMLITPDNVGDIIQTVPNGHLVQIQEVTDQYVQYRDETGSEYGSFHHEIEGTVLQDQERIKAFQNNAFLGSSLKKAELSAIRSILDGNSTQEQKLDANLVLKSVKRMKERLAERVEKHNLPSAKKQPQPRSLNAIISRASAEAKAQQQGKQPVSIGHER